MTKKYTRIKTPVGDMAIVWIRERDVKVERLILPNEYGRFIKRFMPTGHDPAVRSLIESISGYLNGSVKRIPLEMLDWSLCSDFQKLVLVKEWSIPYGHVMSYQQLSGLIRGRQYARAVGSALANNPFPIIIPCHRTVRSDRQLGGYRGGLKLKKWLLKNEGIEFDNDNRILGRYFC